MKRFFKHGFVVLGLVVAIVIMLAMAMSVAVLSSSGQQGATNQIQTTQDYYITHGLLEYALRQIKVMGTQAFSNTLQFLGKPVSLTRSEGKITVNVNGVPQATIPDPTPATQASCLNLDHSGGYINTSLKQVFGLTLNRLASCNTTSITIVSADITWIPDSNYRLKQIHIEGSPEYNNSTGQRSGSNFPFSPYFVINDGDIHPITKVQFDGVKNKETFTFKFYCSDNSSATFTFELLAK